MGYTVDQIVLQDRKIAYAITDRDLNIIELNGPAGIFANQDGDWLGRRLTEVVPELAASEDALESLLKGETSRFQIPWVNRDLPDGQTSYLTMVDLPMRDETGRITGLVHLIHDVTEMGTLEQRIMQQRNRLRLLEEELSSHNVELAAANTELRRMDEVKSAFVSIAAHELRGPLTSIGGYLEMLLDGDAGNLTPKQVEYLRVLDCSAQRLLRITQDLLDVTRIEAGRMDLLLQPADLAAILAGVAAEHAPRLAARSQHLTLQAQPHLPQALCDPQRTAQIVGNLLSNASKYSPPGSPIAVTLAEAAEPGFLQVAVADQGAGISDSDLPRLFLPFSRAGSAALTGVSGTGLGLYIARSLAELHGGRIWCESQLGRGSTFRVTFPAAL